MQQYISKTKILKLEQTFNLINLNEEKAGTTRQHKKGDKSYKN